MLHCTIEQTGWFYMPAVRCAGVSEVAMQSCLLQRNAFGVGIMDRPTVHLSNCSTCQNDQAAFIAEERKFSDARGVSMACTDAKGGDRGRDFTTVPMQSQYPIPKLIKQQTYWNREKKEWTFGNPRSTIRVDPLFGNLTDGWANGLPGWTHGVPEAVREFGDEFVSNAPPSLLADSFLKWGSGRVGCELSKMVANGSIPGDQLTPGFNGGAHEAKLVVADCVVFGDLWGTKGRPGTLIMRNNTLERDPWIEKYFGNRTQRLTVRQMLEALGLRWNARKRTYFKPIRMANGTVVYVRWNETRFCEEAEDGYPGGPNDYPIFDPVTKERLFNHNMSRKVTTREYTLLGYEESIHEDDQALWEYKRRKALLRQARAEARERSARRENDDTGADFGMALVSENETREKAIQTLLDKFLARDSRQDPLFEAIEKQPSLLDIQPR